MPPLPWVLRTSRLLPTHLLVGDLQQVQHHFVGVHVLQQALLLLAHLLPHPAHLVEALQDLGTEGPRRAGAEPGASSGWPPALGLVCIPDVPSIIPGVPCFAHKSRHPLRDPPRSAMQSSRSCHAPSPPQSPQCKDVTAFPCAELAGASQAWTCFYRSTGELGNPPQDFTPSLPAGAPRMCL